MKLRFLFAVITLLFVAAGVRAEGIGFAAFDNGILYFFCSDVGLAADSKVTIKYAVNEDGTKKEKTETITLVAGQFWSGDNVTNVVPEGNKDIHPGWYNGGYSPKITKVVFDVSFADAKPTSCYRWFKGCEKLTTIEGWENLNTENATNLSSMFALCSILKSVDLSHFKTDNVLYMDNMFNGCDSLTSLDVSTFITSNVVEMYAMFKDCKSLTELDLRNFDTQKVKTMGGMFKGCSELASLNISSFKTPELTETGSMFDSCIKLTEIDLTNFDMSKVTLMSSMFHGCKALETIKFNTDVKPNVTGMASVFYDCHALKEIDLSSFNTLNVTIMENLFRNCKALTTLKLGDNFYTENVKGMNFMFGGCTLLESLVFDDKFDTSNVTNMRYMFSGCYALHTLDVSKFNTSNVTNMEGMFSACTALSELDLSSFDTHKVTLMNNMFYNYGPYSILKKIKLGENFTTEKATNLSEMFSFCNALEEIEYVPGGEFKFTTAEGTKLTNLRRMFYGCKNLTSVDLSGLNTENVTYMREMFTDCQKLDNDDFNSLQFKSASGVELMVMDVCDMFQNCIGLTSIDLSGLNTKGIVNTEYTDNYEKYTPSFNNLFSGCTNLQEVNMSSFTYNTSNAPAFENMFKDCNSLQIVDLSNIEQTDGGVDKILELVAEIPETKTPLVFVPDATKKSIVDNWQKCFVYNDESNNEKIFYVDRTEANKEQMIVPYNFNVDKIVINRKYEANKLYTLYVPFAMNATEYGTFYTYEKYDKETKKPAFIKVNSAMTVANTPYLFKPKADTNSLTITVKTVIVATPTADTEPTEGLAGVYNKKTFTSDDIASGIYCYWANGETSFKKVAADNEVDACCAYLKLPTTIAAEDAPDSFTPELQSEGKAYALLLKNNELHFLYSAIEYANGGTYKGENIMSSWFGENVTNTGTEDNLPGWKGMTDVTKVVFNASFANVIVNNCCQWFNDFSSLKDVEGLEYLKMSQNASLASMFESCASLTSLDLSKFNTSNVTNMEYMFAGCNNLLEVDMKNAEISSGATLTDMFKDCNILRFVDLSGASVESTKLSSALGTYRPLMYVKAMAEEGTDVIENVVVGEGTGRTCEHLVIDYDDTTADQLLLKAKYAFKANKITINRKFEADKQLYTLYVPFAMDATAYGTFYTYDSYDAKDNMVNFMAVKEPETATKPNTPYLFKPAGDLNYGIVIETETEVCDNNSELDAAEPTDNGLVGMYRKKSFTEDEERQMAYYCWANGGKNFYFYRVGNGARVDACRAYLKFVAPVGSGAPARLSASFDDGGITGISSAADGDGENTGAAAPAYNLQGQRVGADYKGIVIRNGKKIIVK